MNSVTQLAEVVVVIELMAKCFLSFLIYNFNLLKNIVHSFGLNLRRIARELLVFNLFFSQSFNLIIRLIFLLFGDGIVRSGLL